MRDTLPPPVHAITYPYERFFEKALEASTLERRTIGTHLSHLSHLIPFNHRYRDKPVTMIRVLPRESCIAQLHYCSCLSWNCSHLKTSAVCLSSCCYYGHDDYA